MATSVKASNKATPCHACGGIGVVEIQSSGDREAGFDREWDQCWECGGSGRAGFYTDPTCTPVDNPAETTPVDNPPPSESRSGIWRRRESNPRPRRMGDLEGGS